MTNEELIQKIRAELERLKNDWASLDDELTDAMVAEYDYLLDFLSTLEEQPKEVSNPIFDGWLSRVNPKVREEVRENIDRMLEDDSLIDEIKNFIEEYGYERGEDKLLIAIVARHFYELGCRRTAEKYDEIEYNRQREETAYDTRQYTPRPSVDIEDVARVQFASHAKVFDKKRKAVFDWEQFKEVAGIFYGFGKKDLEPEKPESADLEEAAMNYIAPIENEDGLKVINFSGQDIKNAFIAGAKWQKEQDDRLVDIIYQQGIEKGRDDVKEQMLNEAVEGEVYLYHSYNRDATAILVDISKENLGDKVKIIIVKE